ncbi:MAG: ATP-binding protein [Flavobacteriia bacterium]|nr:ATP-binding protein [Flavobacteriia bacterium]
MTQQELIHKLSDLEWEDFEVKEAKGEIPKSAWETVSAFSNSAGGWLVFGVKQVAQNFEVVAISNPEKIEQDFLATLRSAQKFNVVINPTCVKHNIDGKVVLAFYIPISKNKPVYFNSQANTYIRRGTADQKASKEEIDSLYRDQTFGTKTSEIAAGTSLSDLRDKSIREYRDYMSRFNSSVSYNRMELDDFLVKMRILDKETKQCTFSGLLFFGNRNSIESFFPDFRVDLFEIPGTSNQDSTSRYTFRLSEDDYENLWEVYFECFKRLRKEVDVDFKL